MDVVQAPHSPWPFRQPLAPPLGVEVPGVLRHFLQAVVDLEEKRRHRVFVLVFHGDLGALLKGMGK